MLRNGRKKNKRSGAWIVSYCSSVQTQCVSAHWTFGSIETLCTGYEHIPISSFTENAYWPHNFPAVLQQLSSPRSNLNDQQHYNCIRSLCYQFFKFKILNNHQFWKQYALHEHIRHIMTWIKSPNKGKQIGLESRVHIEIYRLLLWKRFTVSTMKCLLMDLFAIHSPDRPY